MAELLKTEVTRKELEEGIIDANFVLCEMFYDAEGAVTKSGIVYGFNKDITYQAHDDPNDTSSHIADVAETCAKVVKLPEKLYFNPEDENSMPWDCDMELCEGDLVWTNPIESLNAVSLVCENKVYKLLPYSDLYCAKRSILIKKTTEWDKDTMLPKDVRWYDEVVIMLNGYVLCEQVPRPKLSELDITNCDTIDKTRGVIAYLGKPNRTHKRPEYSDFLDLKIGDEVLFDKKYTPFLLERTLVAAKFSQEKLYWVIPRRRIVAVLNRK
jgi:hypothetical protein